MSKLMIGLLLMLVTGCAAFEQSPEDIKEKLADPAGGRLYERDPLEGR